MASLGTSTKKPKLRTSVTQRGIMLPADRIAIAPSETRNSFTSLLSRSASAEFAFGDGNVFGGFLERGHRRVAFLEERPMHDEAA